MDQEPLDPKSFLLPKKDAPSLDSAQRVDAGALYSQEQSATLPKPEPTPAVTPEQNFSAVPTGSRSESSAQVSNQPASIAPLQTFQGDIARVVKDNNVSVVSIAAAEATRRGSAPLADSLDESKQRSASSTLRTVVFVALGIVLIVSALGGLGYALLHNAPLPQQQQGVAPYISIDGTAVATLPGDASATTAMNALVAAKKNISLSLGLVAQLYVQSAATSSNSQATYADAQTLFGIIAPDMPETLMRDIEPVYLLGVHSYGINQPFLILKIDSYEQGYAGMLSWEPTMKQDLYPLFAYTPAPKIQAPTEPAQMASSTASTTPAAPAAFVQTGFTDQIVDNHDARVLLTPDNQIYLLWTFLDRGTLVITTNEGTLHEVIARLTQAPLTSLPNSQ